MKIVMANKYYFLKGGAERYLFELSRLLERDGQEVIPFAMEDPRNLAASDADFFVSAVRTDDMNYGWQGLRTAGRMLWSFEAARKFTALAGKTNPDLLHAHNIYHQLSPSILAAARRLGLPAVMTLHDYHLISPNYLLFDRGRRIDPSKAHPYWDTLAKRTIRGSLAMSALSAFEGWLHAALGVYDRVHFIAPSRFLRDTCVAYGVPAAQVEVIPHFVDLTGRTVAETSERSVVFVGRLSEEKGAGTLIEAMKKNPDIRCVVVGEGPQRTRLRRQAADAKNIIFAGALQAEALWQEVEKARVIVVPSLTYETFGLTVLEAYASGKPVIASRIGALPEIVREGETGLLCEAGDVQELGDKIRSLVDDETGARRMGLAGRALVEREYSPKKHLSAILSAYKTARA